ncbi:programmed cell death protein 2 [Catenaria anguillulae PL171]|uniref:Programmed cell death protein 2 n=1 Tax=Catenaria anguillulae PL171 TaxID=765915 RepID=A0A1Y2HK57_9FUNG|nr:programmed cell death protein 2 [Catenaria anguillulae PL171]
MDDRVLYVFGCNRRHCMLRPGSFVAIRGMSLDGPGATGDGEAGEDEEVDIEEEQEDKMRGDVVFGMVEQSEADAFGGFGSGATDGEDAFGGFGTVGNGDAFTSGFTTGEAEVAHEPAFALGVGSSEDLRFQLTPSASSSSSSKPAPPKAKDEKQATASSSKHQSLEAAMDALTLSAASTEPAPHFPAFYLSIDEEYVQSKHAKAAAYSHYRPGDGSLGDEDATGGEDERKGRKASAAAAAGGPAGWDVSAEGSESTNIKGFTRHLERFVDRVEDNPSQVIRYNFGGVPLMYSEHQVLHLPTDEAQADAAKVAKAQGAAKGKLPVKQRLPSCPRCGGQRVYECQLMPTLLSVLPVEKHAPEPTPAELEAMGKNPAMWIRGMEFGTVIVFTCGENCTVEASEDEKAKGVLYVNEVCLVQLEQE